MNTLVSSISFFGAGFMFMDAVMYSLGVVQPIRIALQPKDDYWDRRLLLNVLFANMGLYFTAIFAFIGSFMARTSIESATPILLFSILVCLYSCISIIVLTPKDWGHTLLRFIAAILLAIALLV